MPINLIGDACLPVRTVDGQRRRIRPDQLSDPTLQCFDSGRPDFDGALYQFAIALLQTAYAPEDGDDWRDAYESPPSSDTLASAFQAWIPHFNLAGEGARFMQDLELSDGEIKPIASLLIDAPGGNTLKQNADHFIKRDVVGQSCPACAALALFTLQTNAPSGGVGHRTSLRGGGPLTTLLEPMPTTSLWHALWLNVFDAETFGRFDQREESTVSVASILPWLRPTQTSENDRKVLPMQVHPLQMYWAMPRRIRLELSDLAAGECDLCGEASDALITSYRTRNYGASYAQFRHPLTPHVLDEKQKLYLAQHGQPLGVGYRDWLGLVLESATEKRYPAHIVERHNQLEERRNIPVQLWAFGYDMDNMKARGWCDSRLPCFTLDDAQRSRLETRAMRMVTVAEKVDYMLRDALRKAWFGTAKEEAGKLKWYTPKTVKLDASRFESIQAAFWRNTSDVFYQKLEASIPLSGAEEHALLEQWLYYLHEQAQSLYREFSDGSTDDIERLKHTELAANELTRFCLNKKMREELNLPTNKRKS